MAEFWIVSNFLRQNSFENPEIHKLCKALAAKYLENEKNEIRANSVREENIILKIDVGNLKELYQTVAEVIEAQSTAEALLTEYYDQQLEMAYDADQQEKIFEYDEIKMQLETRESVSMYEELYNRKMQIARKMEERQIVKKYRQKEEDFLRTENDCLNLEQSVKAIKAETDKIQAAIQETILLLVIGSKQLETAPISTPPSVLMEKRQTPLSATTPDRNLITKKPGLSSRLSIVFNPPKLPSAIVAPRIQTVNPTKGLDRLLQEAEILRKSMKITPESSPPTVKPSIISNESKKEKPRKKVTFNLVTPEEAPMNIVTPPDEVGNSLEIFNSDLAETKQKPKEKCVILENIVVQPPGAPLPVKIRSEDDPKEPEVALKRKIEKDHVFVSPQKKKRIEPDAKIVNESKSFMDMFIKLSKDSTLDISSTSTTKETDAPRAGNKRKPEMDDVVVVEDSKQKHSFDGFEEFFASLTNVGSENNNDDSPKGGDTLDFFDDNGNIGDGGDCGESDFSFQF